MKFCPVVPEICRGQVHGARKERRRIRIRIRIIIIIIIRNGAKTISLNYLCNQCLSQLMLWVRISIMTRCTTLCDKVCQWLAIGQWFSSGPPVFSTNKTDRHDITEILLKVALNTIKQTLFYESLPKFINSSPYVYINP